MAVVDELCKVPRTAAHQPLVRLTVNKAEVVDSEVLPPEVHRGRAWRILGWCLLLAGAGVLWLAFAGPELR